MESDSSNVPVAPTSDKFLLGLLLGALLLLIAGATGVFILRQPAQTLPQDTPGGVIQSFYTALEQNDYSRAHSYISPSMTNYPDLQEFVRYTSRTTSNSQRSQRIRIDAERINGDQATVDVSVTQFSNSRFPIGTNEYTMSETFTLTREAGQWRISGLPYMYLPPRR